jgi:hypothetical protein
MENQEGQSQEQSDIQEQQEAAPSPGVPAPDTTPPEQRSDEEGESTPLVNDPQEEGPPKPEVDDPNLPEEGDNPQQFDPEPVSDDPAQSDRPYDQELDETGEKRDQPNDLSGVDKEFDDEEESE